MDDKTATIQQDLEQARTRLHMMKEKITDIFKEYDKSTD